MGWDSATFEKEKVRTKMEVDTIKGYLSEASRLLDFLGIVPIDFVQRIVGLLKGFLNQPWLADAVVYFWNLVTGVYALVVEGLKTV